MLKTLIRKFVPSWVACACLAGGCSQFPDSPDRPSLSPDQSGDLAIEAFDVNGDGSIDAEEAKASPGMLDAFERVDADGSGAVDAAEIAERVRYYEDAPVTVASGAMVFTMDGRPLADAAITLEPEEFLGGAFEKSAGVTDREGRISLSREGAEFPGIYLGMYRLRVSKQKNGEEQIPERYNAKTELGYEVAEDIPGVFGDKTFALKSK